MAMESGHWAFNNGQREPKDPMWFWGYLGTLITTALVGVLAWRNTCDPML